MAAANRGNPSSAFRWAPRARASLFQVGSGILPFSSVRFWRTLEVKIVVSDLVLVEGKNMLQ
jgi:hypothetical protein